MNNSLNMRSKTYAGNTTIAHNLNRGYLFVLATSGSCTIEFGDGGGQIPLVEGGFYEPLRAPTSEITIVTTGTVIVVSND